MISIILSIKEIRGIFGNMEFLVNHLYKPKIYIR